MTDNAKDQGDMCGWRRRITICKEQKWLGFCFCTWLKQMGNGEQDKDMLICSLSHSQHAGTQMDASKYKTGTKRTKGEGLWWVTELEETRRYNYLPWRAKDTVWGKSAKKGEAEEIWVTVGQKRCRFSHQDQLSSQLHLKSGIKAYVILAFFTYKGKQLRIFFFIICIFACWAVQLRLWFFLFLWSQMAWRCSECHLLAVGPCPRCWTFHMGLLVEHLGCCAGSFEVAVDCFWGQCWGVLRTLSRPFIRGWWGLWSCEALFPIS